MRVIFMAISFGRNNRAGSDLLSGPYMSLWLGAGAIQEVQGAREEFLQLRSSIGLT